jgi:hypothetical protein
MGQKGLKFTREYTHCVKASKSCGKFKIFCPCPTPYNFLICLLLALAAYCIVQASGKDFLKECTVHTVRPYLVVYYEIQFNPPLGYRTLAFQVTLPTNSRQIS